MKIGYFADGPWSHKALELIKDISNAKLTFIVARYPNPDKILQDWAKKLNIPFFVHEDINSKEFLKCIRGLSDINVSLSFNQIFKEDIINSTPMKLINCHAGALPFYRDKKVMLLHGN